jgi:hypothetical protein
MRRRHVGVDLIGRVDANQTFDEPKRSSVRPEAATLRAAQIAGSEARTEVCRAAALPTQRRSASTGRRFRIDPRWLERVTIEMAKPLVRTRGGRSARAVVQGVDLAQAAEQLSRGQRNREGWTNLRRKQSPHVRLLLLAGISRLAAAKRTWR